MKQNEKTGKFYVLIAVALLVTSVAVAVAVAGPAPYPGTGPTPTPGPTPAPGPGGGPAPYPTPAPPPPPPTPTPPPGALPDLVVEDKWETFANGDVIVHFIVKNIGNVEAGESTACKEVSGVVVDTDSVPKLGPDKSYTGAFAAEDCTPGKTITVKVCADNYGVVAESNETNNCMTNTFTCPAGPQPGGPDLVIQITQPVAKQVAAPNLCQYTVEWTATNIGNEEAEANRVALFINNIYNNDVACRALGSGASVVGNFVVQNCPSCGAIVDVEVRVDYYNAEGDESNENNNNDSTTVDCRVDGIEVNKTVHDPAILVGDDKVEMINAEQGDVVKFNCTVHNTGCCCALTDITVTDMLSASLEYINATPVPDDEFHYADGSTELRWHVAGPLEPCNWLNYTINATVIDCGVDTNTQTAVATNCTGGVVSDSDTATVNAPPRAAINVTKEVKNAAGDWVDAIDVSLVGGLPFGPVEFRCTVHNNGTCCNLTDIEVWDTLSLNLTLIDAWGPDAPFTPRPVVVNVQPDGTTDLYWYIPDTIEYCESLVFYINATRVAGTNDAIGNVDTNTQRARAWSPRMSQYVTDQDVAAVNIVA